MKALIDMLKASEVAGKNQKRTSKYAGSIVECFTASHYKDALKGNIKALIDMLKASEIVGKNRKMTSKYAGSIDSLTLPTKPIQRSRKNQYNCIVSSENSTSDTSSTAS
jgi:hypothetical protein